MVQTILIPKHCKLLHLRPLALIKDLAMSMSSIKCKILQLGTNAIDHIFEMKDGAAKSNIEYVTKEKNSWNYI